MRYILFAFMFLFILLIIVLLYNKLKKKENSYNLVSNKLNKKNWLRTNPRLERKYPGRLPGIIFGNNLVMRNNLGV